MRNHNPNKKQEKAAKPTKKPQKEKARSERLCGGGKAHRDAERLAEFVMFNGQWRPDDELVVFGTHDELAESVGFVQEQGGFRRVDSGRYHRARNHMRDYVDEHGDPCTGLTTHYKQLQVGSGLWFIDGTRKRDKAYQALVGTLRGWAQRERQHATECRRMRETLEEFRDSLDANKQGEVYRIATEALIQLDNNGVVPDGLMAQFEAWLSTVSA